MSTPEFLSEVYYQGCPLCDIHLSEKSRYQHVGRHLEKILFRALPLDVWYNSSALGHPGRHRGNPTRSGLQNKCNFKSGTSAHIGVGKPRMSTPPSEYNKQYAEKHIPAARTDPPNKSPEQPRNFKTSSRVATLTFNCNRCTSSFHESLALGTHPHQVEFWPARRGMVSSQSVSCHRL
jgi:hypothetical protein